jgi:serine protease
MTAAAQSRRCHGAFPAAVASLLAAACGGGGGGGAPTTAVVNGSLRVPQTAAAAIAPIPHRPDLPMRPAEVVAWIEPGVDAVQFAGPDYELVQAGGPVAVFRSIAASQRGSLHAGAAVADSCEVATCHAADAIAALPGVRCAQPNYLLQATRQPNDTHFGKQWHYPQINLPQAWDLTTGSANVVVAVLDTGIKAAHPDFDPARVVPGFDMISDPSVARDGNGRDGNPEDVGDLATPQGSSFHGTHVAGTIGARSDNGSGIAGVDWACKLMHVRVLGRGGGSISDIADGILFAARLTNGSGQLPTQRADVVNMSLGGPGLSSVLQQACDAASAAGVLLVAAAGNDNTNQPSSPAAFASVLSVGAVDLLGARAPYSNFHSSIDLWAPGGDMTQDRNGDQFPDGVLSCMADDQGGFFFSFENGTSMASPHVAGVAALVKAANPALTAAQIRAVLLGNTKAGVSLPNGGRVVDALAAVQAAGATAGGPLLVAAPGAVDFGATATSATVICENRGQGAAVTASVTPAPAAPWLSVQTTETAAGNGLTNDTVTLTVDRTGLPTGVYQTRVTLVANVGAASTQVAFDVRMQVGASAGATDEVFVLLVDPLTLETYFQASALPGTGYLWNFGSIAAGQYLLVAGTDRDNDDEIGDDGEWFGAWPDLDAPAPIDAVAGSALTGLQFGLQDLVVVPGSAGAGAGAGARARRTFRRLL